MAKARNCKRTEQERIHHEFAIKIRKMTDQQIYEAWHKAQEERSVNTTQSDSETNQVRMFAEFLKTAPGIGRVTFTKILSALREWECGRHK